MQVEQQRMGSDPLTYTFTFFVHELQTTWPHMRQWCLRSSKVNDLPHEDTAQTLASSSLAHEGVGLKLHLSINITKKQESKVILGKDTVHAVHSPLQVNSRRPCVSNER